MREVRKQSLLGQFYPCSYIKIKIALDNWQVVLRDPCKSRYVEEWEYLEFDFTGHKKKKIYYDLAYFFACGWFMKENLSELARYMAQHSNLANSENLKTRTETIRQGIKRELCKFENIIQYRIEHGGVIIMSQQGYLPTLSKAGTYTSEFPFTRSWREGRVHHPHRHHAGHWLESCSES